MPLPSAHQDPTDAERISAGKIGSLAETPVPDLLARAHRVAFSGTLVFETPGEGPTSIRFANGSVVGANGPFRSSDVEWGVLGRYLPPESIDFAAQHASQYGVDPFQAVERLVLLPAETLDSARQALTVAGVRAACQLEESTRYEFGAPESSGANSERDAPVEPLGLLAECYLVDPHRERAARAIAPFEHSVLTLDTERVRRVLTTVHGPVRAVLDVLLLSPGSVQALRERGVVSSDELVAAVNALLATRIAAIRGYGGGSQTFPAVRPGSSRPPVTPSVPPTWSDSASGLPPSLRPSQAAPPESTGSDRGAKEHAMEQRVEEAWMLAEADPTRAEKIGAVVLKAVSVFPRNPRLRYYLARVHIKANRLLEAVKELETVLSLDPSDVDAVNELARLKELLARPSRMP